MRKGTLTNILDRSWAQDPETWHVGSSWWVDKLYWFWGLGLKCQGCGDLEPKNRFRSITRQRLGSRSWNLTCPIDFGFRRSNIKVVEISKSQTGFPEPETWNTRSWWWVLAARRGHICFINISCYCKHFNTLGIILALAVYARSHEDAGQFTGHVRASWQYHVISTPWKSDTSAFDTSALWRVGPFYLRHVGPK